MNLVLNARDAMPAGGLLRVETFVASFDRQAIRRSSASSTPAPAFRRTACRRIFDPFYTTKDAGKGSGLGLATAFGIVAQHGGRIEVVEPRRHGTTFEVVLPVEHARDSSRRHRLRAVPAPRGGTETILLVEDELAVRY